MTEVLNCICGNAPAINGPGIGHYYVACLNLKCFLFGPNRAEKDKAIEIWNIIVTGCLSAIKSQEPVKEQPVETIPDYLLGLRLLDHKLAVTDRLKRPIMHELSASEIERASSIYIDFFDKLERVVAELQEGSQLDLVAITPVIEQKLQELYSRLSTSFGDLLARWDALVKLGYNQPKNFEKLIDRYDKLRKLSAIHDHKTDVNILCNLDTRLQELTVDDINGLRRLLLIVRDNADEEEHAAARTAIHEILIPPLKEAFDGSEALAVLLWAV